MTTAPATSKIWRHLILGCSLLALGSVTETAWAQAAPADGEASADSGDIIVTAQKRNERLQDVPISIAALGGDELQRRGVTSANDLQKVVPGFTYKTSPNGIPIYFIRGIGFDDNSNAATPAVSVSVDQVPLPFLAMAQGVALDLERVEVLKGPQGTLFGQNTTGGAVNFIAAKPTDELHAGFNLTYGTFNQIDGSGFISGPISDTLRVRLAVAHENRDGWQISRSRPNDRLGARDFTVGRLLVDWTPTDTLKIEFNVNGWRDRSESQAVQFQRFDYSAPPPRGSTLTFDAIGTLTPTPADARLADWDAGVDYRHNDSQHQFSARADLKASDNVTITSISSYAKFKTSFFYDADGTNFQSFLPNSFATLKTFSQELRVAADLGGAKIVVGGNYQHDNTDQKRVTITNASNSQVGPFVTAAFGTVGPLRLKTFGTKDAQIVSTYAVFASVDVPLTATLTAQAGVRYTKQNRNDANCLYDTGDGTSAAAFALIPQRFGLPYAPVAPGACVSLDTSFKPVPIINAQLNEDNVSWRAGLNWKPSSDLMVYANVTRGYKAGSFPILAAVFVDQAAGVTQEKVTAYELGVKASLLDRKVDVAAAVFYNDYVNKQLLGYQVVPVFGNLLKLLNVPKSKVQGAEFSITARPATGLTLAGGITYVKTEVTQSFVTNSPISGAQVDIKGESFPNSPRWQGSASFNYETPISDSLTASIGGDVSFRSAAPVQFTGDPRYVFEAYALLGLRAGIGAADGRWGLDVWGKNITNKYYWNNVFRGGETTSRSAGMPATYGVTLRARF